MTPKKKAAKKAVKKAVKKNGHYIVIWDDNDGDPVATFSTEKEARDFCEALLTKDMDKAPASWNVSYNFDVDNVDPQSIKLYKGELIGKAEVTVTFK